MQCPYHTRAEVVGYCVVCGAFGCSECLKMHEGNYLCARHYQPIAQKIEEKKRQSDLRKKHPRQLLAVRYLDGRCQYGVCYALNPREAGFHLDLVDGSGVPLGKTEAIRFQDLKAVFLVKSLDGSHDKTARYQGWDPEGEELVVKFQDGEVIRGVALHRYNPNEPRFHVIPKDPTSNSISVLIENTAVEGVYTPEEYKAKLAEERETSRKNEGPTTLTQEESLGDFYFETRNYDTALEQYQVAMAKSPQSGRLRRKWLLTQYNVGMQHIKRRAYDKALACMEAILKHDPKNERVLKKAAQLRHILEKEKTGPRTQQT